MAEDYMALYRKALTGLETGGKTLEASLQEIEEGKKQAIGRGQQALVSGGLGGTTTMGAVPIQAEKIAARQRLGARGRAEETYLTTLASFAAFAQRGEEAARQRRFEAQQAELERIERRPPSPGTAESPYDVFGRLKEGRGPAGSIGDAGIGAGGGYAEQFPSLYDQGGAVPDWMGTGAGAGAGGGFDMGLEEQGWRGAQVIGEKGVLAGAPLPQEVGMTGGMGALPGMTGEQNITIYARGTTARTGVTPGTTKSITIPSGMTPLEAMQKGHIPKGWNIR